MGIVMLRSMYNVALNSLRGQ